MHYFKSIIIMVFYFYHSALFAQISPPPDYEWRVNYTETTKTYFRVGSNTNLTNLDKGRLKETTEVSYFEKYYTTDSNMPLTFIERDHARSSYKDYMVKPKSFVIDQHGISAYGNKGELIKTIYHTKKYLELAKFRSDKVFLSFLAITEKDLRTFEGNTDNITIDENGIITATGQTGTLIYNPVRKTKTFIRIGDDGEPVSTTLTQYIPVISVYPDYPNKEDVVPLFIKDIVKEELPSGGCSEFVKIKMYEDYDIDGGSQAQFRSSKSLSQVSEHSTIYPNPATDLLNVEGMGDDPYLMKVFSIDGILVMERVHTGPVQIDIEAFQEGIYFISLQSGEEESIHKFIKQ